MECLENLVGLSTCDTPSTAPCQIEQLGISRKQLTELLDDSYPTIEDWFDAMKEKAAKDIVSDILGNLTKGVKSNSLIENGMIGEYQNGRIEVSTSTFAGIYMDLDSGADYLTYNISSINLYMNFTGDVEVTVVNSRTGETLETITIAAEAGKIVRMPVSISISNKKQPLSIAIIYDTTGKPSYKTTMSNSGCTSCGRGDGKSVSSAYFQSVDTASPFLVSNNGRRKDTAGMSIEYSFICDPESWVCSIASQLALSMLYRTAFNLFAYSILSGERMNDQKTINFESNVERKDMFEFSYGEHITKVFKSIKFPIGRCFECNSRVFVTNSLPG